MKHVLTTCALIVAMTVPTLSSFADGGQVVYRWKDAQGDPVNSDRPPPVGIEYEVISTKSSMVRAVDDEEEGAVPAKAALDPQTQSEPVDTAAKIEKNADYCKRAQENLEALDSKVRIQMRNEQGEVYFLSEEEREIQRQRALDTIKVHC